MSPTYEVRIRGRLSPTLLAEFEDLALTASVEPVQTVLSGPVEDQAALYGLLRRIEALGLELIELRSFRSRPCAPEAELPGRQAPTDDPTSGG